MDTPRLPALATSAMRWVLALGLCLGFVSSSEAFSIPWERQQGWLTPTGFRSLLYRYDIGVIDDVLWVDLDIALTGADPSALWARWESGIEQIWSTDRFDVPIRLNVDRVTDDADQVVTVIAGAVVHRGRRGLGRLLPRGVGRA